MRRSKSVLALILLCSLSAVAGDKPKGVATLKDFQPAGTTDKHHKKQQFDLTFDATRTEYVCRTSKDAKLKATEWPVGDNISYELDNDKGKVKNSRGKKVDCKVMRVEALKSASAASN
jgi:hypothetical protein